LKKRKEKERGGGGERKHAILNEIPKTYVSEEKREKKAYMNFLPEERGQMRRITSRRLGHHPFFFRGKGERHCWIFLLTQIRLDGVIVLGARRKKKKAMRPLFFNGGRKIGRGSASKVEGREKKKGGKERDFDDIYFSSFARKERGGETFKKWEQRGKKGGGGEDEYTPLNLGEEERRGTQSLLLQPKKRWGKERRKKKRLRTTHFFLNEEGREKGKPFFFSP